MHEYFYSLYCCIAFTPTTIKIKQTSLPQGITYGQPYTSSKGECFVLDWRCVLIE